MKRVIFSIGVGLMTRADEREGSNKVVARSYQSWAKS